MQLKHVIFIILTVAYTGYYVGVSKGMIKKEAHSENEKRTAVQKLVDAITPDSPQEKRLNKSHKLDILYEQLRIAQSNYDSYDNWRSEAAANPPT